VFIAAPDSVEAAVVLVTFLPAYPSFLLGPRPHWPSASAAAWIPAAPSSALLDLFVTP
jgi:hypothetical protein